MKHVAWIVVALTMTAFGTASATDSTPVKRGPTEVRPDFGGCIYECDTTGVRYRIRSQCEAACTGFCEPIC